MISPWPPREDKFLFLGRLKVLKLDWLRQCLSCHYEEVLGWDEKLHVATISTHLIQLKLPARAEQLHLFQGPAT